MTHGLTIQDRDERDNLTGDWRYATPDEIKAAHPKCGTCGFLKPVKRRAGFYCSNKDSLEEDSCIEFPDIHYCIYHKPKAQP